MNKNKTGGLPEGWIWIKLDDAGEIISGGTPSTKVPEYWNGNIVWITPADLSGHKAKVIKKGAKSISANGLKKSSARLMPKGSVLFSSRAPIGYVVIAGVELCTNQGFKSIVPNKGVYNEFLYYYLKSAKRKAEDAASGTTFKEISLGKFADLDFLLPPLPEQHSIVSKIEQLFSELDKGIESLKTAQQQLKVSRQSVLKWAFEGKLTEKWRQNQDLPDAQELLEQIQKEREEKAKASGKKLKQVAPLTKEELAALPALPDGWGWVNIEIIVDTDKYSLKAGPFGSSLKKEFYVEKGYKIYGQEQVIAGNSLNGDYYISKEKFEELISNKIQPHDILISLVGTVGKVLILPEHCEPGIINPRLIKVTLNRNYYNPLFFKYYFESSFLKSLYSSKAQGTTMDVLNLGIIKALPFPICSIPEQHQIVQEIESRLSECDNMEATIAASLQQAEALRQSILKKAFEGRLLNDEELEAVRQDPAWEPAEELLERIMAEKAMLQSKKPGLKGKHKV